MCAFNPRFYRTEIPKVGNIGNPRKSARPLSSIYHYRAETLFRCERLRKRVQRSYNEFVFSSLASLCICAFEDGKVTEAI